MSGVRDDRARVRDDRGRSVHVSFHFTPGAASMKRIGMTEGEVFDMNWMLRRERVRRTAFLLGIIYLFALLIFIPILVMMSGAAAPPVGTEVILVVLCVVPAFVVWHFIARGAPGRMRSVLIRLGRCASCGYALTGLTSEDDGCTVCPECGSAWKLPDPVH